MLNSVVLRQTWLVKGVGVILLLLGILSLAACQPVQRQASGTAMPDAAGAIPEIMIRAQDFAFDMPDELPAGLVSLTLANEGQVNHHAIISRLKEGVTLDRVKEVLQDPAGDAAQLGDLSFFMPDTDPGASNQATVELAPGRWVIFSVSMAGPPTDAAPDWARGSIKEFTVTDAGTAAQPPQADLTVTIGAGDAAMPAELTAGKHTIHVVNDSGKADGWAFFIKLGDDMTVQDLLDAFDALFAGKTLEKMPVASTVGGLMGYNLGKSFYTTIEFAPGNYAVITSINATDFPYSGMSKSFTVADNTGSSAASSGSTADRFAGTWAGTMSFDVDPNHKEEIRVVIPEGCQVGAVCGSIENETVQCTWEMTLAALLGDTFDYTFSNTLSGECPARGGGKLTLQTDGTLMREHKTPDFTASGPLTRQE